MSLVRDRRRALAPALASLLAAYGAAGGPLAPSARSAPQDPAAQLIREYSPIVMLRAQRNPPCDSTEEQYEPTTVGVVLGNPRVRLIGPARPGGRRTLLRAPTVADVAGRGPAWHLDLPGDALEPECTYARDFRALVRAGRAPPVTYAHIARERGHRGFVVQYWFFYYFNQFNDVHEGDWEGMQVAFDAEAPQAALREGPSEIALYQHGGGEASSWASDKVEKQGTHPVVYVAAGSHATFFEPAVFVENGQGGSGLGCDNSTEPLRRVVPAPVIVPTYPARGSPDAWLTYLGHWGERQKGFNNGPQGPITKRQWIEPFGWMSGLRSASPKLPGGSLMGPAVTDAFCKTVAAVSSFVNLEAKSRTGALVLVLILVVLVAGPAGITRWRPVDVTQLRKRRAVGQLLRAARRLYGRHWRPLVLIGLTAVPILGVVDGAQWLLHHLTGSHDLNLGSGGFRLRFSDPVGSLGRPVGFAIVASAVIVLVRELDAGRAVGFRSSYRGTFERFWRVAFAQLVADALVAAMVLTIIGIPFAVRKYIDWQFAQQEVLFKDVGIREALRGSSRLVRGRWWHTLGVAGLLWLLTRVTGPVLGFGLIFANFSLPAIDLLGALVFALLTPYVAVARTLLYFDLGVRRAEEPERGRRRWAPSRRPGRARPSEG